MPLTTGTRLGPYEIVAPLGRGGMGEVYRAKDTRLDREVAVKVLPADTAADAEHRARFEREARAVAALSHPHICTLHDIGRSGETDYIVMELVQGETLAARLAKGPLPLGELLTCGAEIAEALQVAHRAGVLHRDLKPANIMLARAGAKLMDFGLARSTPRDIASIGRTQASTEAVPITGEGRIVGTVQYMSPEQLEGRVVDTRSDIWAFGVTLYEMATAQRPFVGASSASVIGAILRDEPAPLTKRAPLTPPALDRLVRRCLAKDPESRWQSAGDLAHELRWIAGGGVDAPGEGPALDLATRGARPSVTGAGWAGIGVALTVLAVAAAIAIPRLQWDALPVVKSSLPLPIFGARLLQRDMAALSPDGRKLALVLPDSMGTMQLFVRPLDQDVLLPLGDPGAYEPFWSPDSRQIAYQTDEEKLVRIDVEGGAAQTICKAPDLVAGTWGRDHWIVFGNSTGPLLRVRDTGGQPEPVTTLDSTRHETVHGYPEFLPDGTHFTYLTSPPLGPNSSRVRVGCSDRSRGWDLMVAHHAPVSDGSGWLVFMRDRALLAQRITSDGRRLLGEPVPMPEVPDRSGSGSDPIVQLSRGNLIYRPLITRPVRISWYSRQGVPLARVAGEPFVIAPEVSPDGKRAVMRGVQGDETWLVEADLETGDVQRLTSMESWNSWPIWSASGNEILYTTGADGSIQLRAMDPRAPAANRIVTTQPVFTRAEVEARDGSGLFVNQEVPGHAMDIVVLDPHQGFAAHPLIATAADELGAALVDGGRRIVYASNATGRYELYLATVSAPQSPTRLTRDGCAAAFGLLRQPVWAVGDELFYCSADGQTLRSLKLVHAGESWRAGEDRALFALPPGLRGLCPAPDGSRFLLLTNDPSQSASTLTLVQGWRAELMKHPR